MKRVCVVCEGQSEETFVRTVLTPAFVQIGVLLIGEMIETSTGHRGGALNYDRVKRHVRNTLRQSSKPFVTTMFDLYRLDTGFPGFADSRKQPALESRLAILLNSFHADIIQQAGCTPDRFIPHLQPFEFESLLFSDVDTLVSVEERWTSAAGRLRAIRAAAATPEHINDDPNTHPAVHLMRELRDPRYRKARHGPIASGKIGLARIEKECLFFATWLSRLRALSESSS